MGLFAKSALRADAKTVSHQQHSEKQFRLDGWATRVAVVIRKVCPNAAQINEAVNRPQQVILRDMTFQRELVEQRCLCFLLRSQHRKPSHSLKELNQRCASQSRKSFSTQSAQGSHSLRLL
jgi:hypothetical protein